MSMADVQAPAEVPAEVPAEAPQEVQDVAMQVVAEVPAEVQWMQQCSKHLHYIEKRMMENEFLGHEVVRQSGIVIDAFRPPPYGDWGWFLRSSQDISVRTLRHLVRTYHKGHETMDGFLMRAVELVRLYMRRRSTAAC